jgi:putative proteasome-type protease
MTYCVAIALKQGLVLTSDSRTNAGIDSVHTYSKMHHLVTNDDRDLVLLSAGNLATTQTVVEQIRRDIEERRDGNLNQLNYLSEAAAYLGIVSRETALRFRSDAHPEFNPEATFILAGRIGNRSPAAYLIYPQGNFITTSAATPYLQIGESKYGKPVLDRFLTENTSLDEALICSLISMDSTMRSNASVGPPIEVLVIPSDCDQRDRFYRLDADHPFLHEIRRRWAEALQSAFRSMATMPLPELE